MKWRLYKKDDPNTWPQIDCPMIVYYGDKLMSAVYSWDNDKHCFVDDRNIGEWNFEECYYSRITYVPSGHKTTYPTKCMQEWDKRCGFDDDGYCMADRTYACQYKRDVPEYSIEEKRIWKEFE
jgi:hypothetical protein